MSQEQLPIFVEVLDRRGQVRTRTQITSFPATIGRSYSSTVIVDDPYVAPLHATLEVGADGAVTVSDAGTVNGLLPYGGKPSTSRVLNIPIQGTTDLAIGKTRVRLVTADMPVPPERALVQERSVSYRWLAVALAALTLWVGFDAWWGMIDEAKPTSIVAATLAVLGGLLVWSGGWAFATRLLQGQPKLAQHAFILAVALLLWEVVQKVLGVAAFSLNLSGLVRWQILIGIAFGVALLAAHIHVANGGITRLMWGLLGTVAAGVLAMSFLQNYQTHKTISPGRYMTQMFPPSWQLTGGNTSDSFFLRAQQDKARVDALRAVDSDAENFSSE